MYVYRRQKAYNLDKKAYQKQPLTRRFTPTDSRRALEKDPAPIFGPDPALLEKDTVKTVWPGCAEEKGFDDFKKSLKEGHQKTLGIAFSGGGVRAAAQVD